MPNLKKIDLLLPEELFKALKLKANQTEQPISAWILDLITRELQSEVSAIQPSDWGRIDSRIDQRTIFLEHKIDHLNNQLHELKHQLNQAGLLSVQALSDYESAA
jgi:hypothetical protein